MEAGILEDLVFTVSLTAIIYYVLSKFLSNCDGDVTNATCNSTSDGFIDKAGLLELVCEKYRILDLGKERNLGINSGFQVVASSEEADNDHEAEELKKEETVGEDNTETNEEALCGAFVGVLERMLKGEEDCVGGGGGVGVGVGGREDIKEKLVDKCSELRPTTSKEVNEEKDESPLEEVPVLLSLKDELEACEGKNEGVCGVLEGENSEEKEGEATQSTENGEGNDSNDKVGEDKEEGLFDDWEGIERTDLEKRFDAAVAFVGSKINSDRIDANLRMQLYGLHMVAMEGPCHRPQPMALKVSARAKW